MFWKIVSCIIIFLGIGMIIHDPSIHTRSICKECGALNNHKEYRWPLKKITYFSSNSISDTLLTTYLKDHDLISPHTHQWIFTSSKGPGNKRTISCTCIASMVNDQQKINALDAHLKYEGEAAAKEWVKNMMRLDRMEEFRRLFAYPENDFHNKDEFIKWKNRFLKSMIDLESNK